MHKLNRRDFLGYAGIAAASTLIGGCRALDGEHAARPNIIFILTDDQRGDTLGCMGNKIVQTPNIDRLAAAGTLFENAAVTSAICTPSRATFLTGQYERRHGINFNSGTAMSEEAWEKTYPMELKRAGYFIGYVGKNHVPVGGEGYCTGLMDNSFDYWYAGHTHLRFYLKERPAGYFKVEGDEKMFDNAAADTQTEILEEGVMNFLESNEDFYSGASRFLEKRPSDKPFCLSLCFNLPHDAGTGNMENRPSDPELYRSGYRDKYDEILADLPKTYIAAKDIKTPKLPADVLIAEKRQTGYDYVNTPDELVERIIRRYQTITGIDNLVGNLRDKLERLGLADNTVIIFCSDHGILRGEFGLGGKALCYEPCIKIPMIIYDPRAPKKAKGQRRAELVQSIDVAPTILDLASADIPASMQGESMLPLVHGKDAVWRKYAFSENLWSTYFGNPRVECVHGEKWKYLRYFKNDRSLYDGIQESARYMVSNLHAATYRHWLWASIEGEKPVYEELFYLPGDPDETTNLADDEKYLPAVIRLREICDKLVKQARGDEPPAVVDLHKERLEFYLQTMKHD